MFSPMSQDSCVSDGEIDLSRLKTMIMTSNSVICDFKKLELSEFRFKISTAFFWTFFKITKIFYQKTVGEFYFKKVFFIHIVTRWSPLCRKSMLNIDSFKVFFWVDDDDNKWPIIFPKMILKRKGKGLEMSQTIGGVKNFSKNEG